MKTNTDPQAVSPAVAPMPVAVEQDASLAPMPPGGGGGSSAVGATAPPPPPQEHSDDDMWTLQKVTKLLRDFLFPPVYYGAVTIRSLGTVELFFWTLIMAAAVNSAFENGTDPALDVSITIDFVITILFLLEFGLRYALNPARALEVTASFAQLTRGGDLAVMLLSFTLHILYSIDVIPVMVPVLVLRSPRLLRPLFVLTVLQPVRLFVVPVLRAVLSIKDVIALYALLLLWFGSSGVYEFAGLARTRCVSAAYYTNDSYVGAFINVNNLTIDDFVCGSRFLSHYNLYEGQPYYENFINSSQVDVSTLNRTLSCSTGQTCVPLTSSYSAAGWRCPYGFDCVQVQNPFYDYVGFDNIGMALRNLVICLTFKLWYELMWWLVDAGAFMSYIFFIVFTVFGSLLIGDMITALLTFEFDKAKVAERLRLATQLKGISFETQALRLVQNPLTASLARVRGVPLQQLIGETPATTQQPSEESTKREAPGQPSAAKPAAQGRRGGTKRHGADGREQPLIEMTAVAPNEEAATANYTEWDKDWTPELQRRDEQQLSAAPSGAAALLANDNNEELDGFDEVQPAETGTTTRSDGMIAEMRKFVYQRIIKTPLFTIVSALVILLNFGVIAYNHYDMSEHTQQLFNEMNFAFTVLYTVEMVVRFLAQDPLSYLKRVVNLLDVAIVILGWVQYATGANILAFRALRLFRLVKLLKFFPRLYEIITVILSALRVMPMLVVLQFMAWFTFACIGMSLFAGQFCGFDLRPRDVAPTPQSSAFIDAALNGTANVSTTTAPTPAVLCAGNPASNFDSFGTALLVGFQIMTRDKWDEVMYAGMLARGSWVTLVVVLYVLVAGIVLVSLITAVLLSMNQHNDEDFSNREDLETRIKRLEAQEEEEERRRAEQEKRDKLHHDDARSDSDDESAVVRPGGGGSRGALKAGGAGGGGGGKKVVRIQAQQRSSKQQAKNKTLADHAFDQLFVVWKLSKKMAKRILAHPATTIVLSIMIFVGCIGEGLETPIAPPDTLFTRSLQIIEIVVTTIYGTELLLNVHAYGLFSKTTSYLRRDRWNVLDALIVVAMIVGVVANSYPYITWLQYVRMLRALLPLRLVKRSPGMRLVFSSLMHSSPQLFSVFFLGLVAMLMFGVIGVEFFAGRFRQCNIDGQFSTAFSSVASCAAAGGSWENPPGNVSFDSLLDALVTLYMVLTLEKWVVIMQHLTQSTPAAALYFIAFVLFISLFIVNMFVAVLVDAYNRERRKGSVRRSLFVTREQEAWIITNRRIVKHLPVDDKKIDTASTNIMDVLHRENTRLRRRVREFVRRESFKQFMALIIILSFVSLVLQTYPPSTALATLDNVAYIVFTFLFGVEAVLKIYGETWPIYIAVTWNRTDLFILLASIVSLILGAVNVINTDDFGLIRALRVIRLARFVRRYFDVNMLLRRTGKVLWSLSSVLAFSLVVFYVFALLGASLFGRVKWGVFGVTDGVDHNSNFQRIDRSMILLLRVTFGGNWENIMESAGVSPPYCDEDIGDCGLPAPWPQIYFGVFISVATFILKNLFIAVILDSFHSSGEDRSITKHDALVLYERWKLFDPEGEMLIAPFDIIQFLRQIPAKCLLGFNGRPRRERVKLELEYLVSLKLTNTKDKVPLALIIDQLCAKTYNAPRPENGHFVDALTGSKSFIGKSILSKMQSQVTDFARGSTTLTMRMLSATTGAAMEWTKKLQESAAHLAGLEFKRDAEGETLAELLQRKQEEKAAREEALLKLQQEQEEEARRLAAELRLFTEMASLILINAIVKRHKDSIKEQLILHEKIAHRKFNEIGFVRARRALQRQNAPHDDAAADVLAPVANLVRSELATSSFASRPEGSAVKQSTKKAQKPLTSFSGSKNGTVVDAWPAGDNDTAKRIEEAGTALPMRGTAVASSGRGLAPRGGGAGLTQQPQRKGITFVVDVNGFFPYTPPDEADALAHRIGVLARRSTILPKLTSSAEKSSTAEEGGGEVIGPYAPAAMDFVRAVEGNHTIAMYVSVANAAALRESHAAQPNDLGKLVAAASFVAAATSQAVENAMGQHSESQTAAIETVLPLALLPKERERVGPASIRLLLTTLRTEIAFMEHLLERQRHDLNAEPEITLLKNWYSAEVPYDSIPTDPVELRRWGHQPTNVLSIKSSANDESESATDEQVSKNMVRSSTNDFADEDSHTETSHTQSRPHSTAESLAGAEMEAVDLINLPVSMDLWASFHYGFFDRIEVIYGIVCAVAAMAPANLNAPFPKSTAQPLIDDIIDHVGSVEIEWDHVVQAYIDEGPSALFVSQAAAAAASGKTADSLRSGGGGKNTAKHVKAGLLTSPLPLQLNFKSPFVAELLNYVAEALRKGSAPNGDGTYTSTSKPSSETLQYYKQQLSFSVDSLKAARLAKREKWALEASPSAARTNILAGLARSSAAQNTASIQVTPSVLPTDEQFAPILRRCRNFRTTAHKYILAMRHAVMQAMLSLNDIMDSRRRALRDNIELRESKVKYADMLADMVSLVDETSSWMPAKLRVAAEMAHDDTTLELGSPGRLSTSHHHTRHFSSKEIENFFADQLAAYINAQPGIVAQVKAAAITARLSATAARLTRLALLCIRRRAHADNSEFGSDALDLLTQSFTDMASLSLDRIMEAALETDELVRRRALPLWLSPIPKAPNPSSDRVDASLRGVLSVLQGPEFRERVGILMTRGVCVSVVRRWVRTNPAATPVPGDPSLVVQIEPGETCKHWLRLSADLLALELWKPGSSRAPVTRICLSEIASVDADLGPQAKIITFDTGKELGRLIRITLGYQTMRDADDSTPRQVGESSGSSEMPTVSSSGGASGMRLNSRFEFVPDETAATEELGLRIPVESGHVSTRDSFLVGALRGGGGNTTPDGELITPASKSQATYGLRAVMSSSAYVLHTAGDSASKRHTQPQTVVFVLPASLGYTEWMMLLRDIVRFAVFLPLVLHGILVRGAGQASVTRQTSAPMLHPPRRWAESRQEPPSPGNK